MRSQWSIGGIRRGSEIELQHRTSVPKSGLFEPLEVV
jgi:hypothetical protein